MSGIPSKLARQGAASAPRSASQRHSPSPARRCRPPSQRSKPISATRSARPASTSAPAAVSASSPPVVTSGCGRPRARRGARTRSRRRGTAPPPPPAADEGPLARARARRDRGQQLALGAARGRRARRAAPPAAGAAPPRGTAASGRGSRPCARAPRGSLPRNASQPARAARTCSEVTGARTGHRLASSSGSSSPRPAKPRAAREGADADQLDADRAVGQPGQDLQELQLVVEVVLEPQHDALARLDARPSRSSRARNVASISAAPSARMRGEVLPRARSQLGRGSAGTGPSCRTSRQGTMSPTTCACRMVSTVLSPLVTCSTS